MPGKVQLPHLLFIERLRFGEIQSRGKICKIRGERGAGISGTGRKGPLRPSSRWSLSAAQRSPSGFPPALPRSLRAASLGLRFLLR